MWNKLKGAAASALKTVGTASSATGGAEDSAPRAPAHVTDDAADDPLRLAGYATDAEAGAAVGALAASLVAGIRAILGTVKPSPEAAAKLPEWAHALLELIGADSTIDLLPVPGPAAAALASLSRCSEFSARCCDVGLPSQLVHCFRLLRVVELEAAKLSDTSTSTAKAATRLSVLLSAIAKTQPGAEAIKGALPWMLALSVQPYPAGAQHLAPQALVVVQALSNGAGMSGSLVWYLHERQAVQRMLTDLAELMGDAEKQDGTSLVTGAAAEETGAWLVGLQAVCTLVHASLLHSRVLLGALEDGGGLDLLGRVCAAPTASPARRTAALAAASSLVAGGGTEGSARGAARHASAFGAIQLTLMHATPGLRAAVEAAADGPPHAPVCLALRGENAPSEVLLAVARVAVASPVGGAAPGQGDAQLGVMETLLQLYSSDGDNYSALESKATVLPIVLAGYSALANEGVKVMALKTLEYTATGVSFEPETSEPAGSPASASALSKGKAVPASPESALFAACTAAEALTERLLAHDSPLQSAARAQLLADMNALLATLEKLVTFDHALGRSLARDGGIVSLATPALRLVVQSSSSERGARGSMLSKADLDRNAAAADEDNDRAAAPVCAAVCSLVRVFALHYPDAVPALRDGNIPNLLHVIARVAPPACALPALKALEAITKVSALRRDRDGLTDVLGALIEAIGALSSADDRWRQAAALCALRNVMVGEASSAAPAARAFGKLRGLECAVGALAALDGAFATPPSPASTADARVAHACAVHVLIAAVETIAAALGGGDAGDANPQCRAHFGDSVSGYAAVQACLFNSGALAAGSPLTGLAVSLVLCLATGSTQQARMVTPTRLAAAAAAGAGGASSARAQREQAADEFAAEVEAYVAERAGKLESRGVLVNADGACLALSIASALDEASAARSPLLRALGALVAASDAPALLRLGAAGFGSSLLSKFGGGLASTARGATTAVAATATATATATAAAPPQTEGRALLDLFVAVSCRSLSVVRLSATVRMLCGDLVDFNDGRLRPLVAPARDPADAEAWAAVELLTQLATHGGGGPCVAFAAVGAADATTGRSSLRREMLRRGASGGATLSPTLWRAAANACGVRHAFLQGLCPNGVYAGGLPNVTTCFWIQLTPAALSDATGDGWVWLLTASSADGGAWLHVGYDVAGRRLAVKASTAPRKVPSTAASAASAAVAATRDADADPSGGAHTTYKCADVPSIVDAPGQWHHVAVSHSRHRSLMSKFDTVAVFVDGCRALECRLDPVPLSAADFVSPAAKAAAAAASAATSGDRAAKLAAAADSRAASAHVQAFVGCPPPVACVTGAIVEADVPILPFRLGPIVSCTDALPDRTVVAMYAAGPDAGEHHFCGTAPLSHSHAAALAGFVRSLHRSEPTASVAMALRRRGFHAGRFAACVSASGTPGSSAAGGGAEAAAADDHRMHALADDVLHGSMDSVLFACAAGVHAGAAGAPADASSGGFAFPEDPEDADGRAGGGGSESERERARRAAEVAAGSLVDLVDLATEHGGPRPDPPVVLVGFDSIVAPTSLQRALTASGGAAALLPLLRDAPSPAAACAVLALLGSLQSRESLGWLHADNGYACVAWLLRRNPSLRRDGAGGGAGASPTAVLESCFELALDAPPRGRGRVRRVLADPLALRHLVLNPQLWPQGEGRWKCATRTLTLLATLVDGDEPNAAFNAHRLYALGVTGFLTHTCLEVCYATTETPSDMKALAHAAETLARRVARHCVSRADVERYASAALTTFSKSSNTAHASETAACVRTALLRILLQLCTGGVRNAAADAAASPPGMARAQSAQPPDEDEDDSAADSTLLATLVLDRRHGAAGGIPPAAATAAAATTAALGALAGDATRGLRRSISLVTSPGTATAQWDASRETGSTGGDNGSIATAARLIAHHMPAEWFAAWFVSMLEGCHDAASASLIFGLLVVLLQKDSRAQQRLRGALARVGGGLERVVLSLSRYSASPRVLVPVLSMLFGISLARTPWLRGVLEPVGESSDEAALLPLLSALPSDDAFVSAAAPPCDVGVWFEMLMEALARNVQLLVVAADADADADAADDAASASAANPELPRDCNRAILAAVQTALRNSAPAEPPAASTRRRARAATAASAARRFASLSSERHSTLVPPLVRAVFSCAEFSAQSDAGNARVRGSVALSGGLDGAVLDSYLGGGDGATANPKAAPDTPPRSPALRRLSVRRQSVGPEALRLSAAPRAMSGEDVGATGAVQAVPLFCGDEGAVLLEILKSLIREMLEHRAGAPAGGASAVADVFRSFPPYAADEDVLEWHQVLVEVLQELAEELLGGAHPTPGAAAAAASASAASSAAAASGSSQGFEVLGAGAAAADMSELYASFAAVVGHVGRLAGSGAMHENGVFAALTFCLTTVRTLSGTRAHNALGGDGQKNILATAVPAAQAVAVAALQRCVENGRTEPRVIEALRQHAPHLLQPKRAKPAATTAAQRRAAKAAAPGSGGTQSSASVEQALVANLVGGMSDFLYTDDERMRDDARAICCTLLNLRKEEMRQLLTVSLRGGSKKVDLLAGTITGGDAAPGGLGGGFVEVLRRDTFDAEVFGKWLERNRSILKEVFGAVLFTAIGTAPAQAATTRDVLNDLRRLVTKRREALEVERAFSGAMGEGPGGTDDRDLQVGDRDSQPGGCEERVWRVNEAHRRWQRSGIDCLATGAAASKRCLARLRDASLWHGALPAHLDEDEAGAPEDDTRWCVDTRCAPPALPGSDGARRRLLRNRDFYSVYGLVLVEAAGTAAAAAESGAGAGAGADSGAESGAASAPGAESAAADGAVKVPPESSAAAPAEVEGEAEKRDARLRELTRAVGSVRVLGPDHGDDSDLDEENVDDLLDQIDVALREEDDLGDDLADGEAEFGDVAPSVVAEAVAGKASEDASASPTSSSAPSTPVKPTPPPPPPDAASPAPAAAASSAAIGSGASLEVLRGLLDPQDGALDLTHVHNATRCAGLERRAALFCLTRGAAYVFDGFQRVEDDANGGLRVEVVLDELEARAEMVTASGASWEYAVRVKSRLCSATAGYRGTAAAPAAAPAPPGTVGEPVGGDDALVALLDAHRVHRIQYASLWAVFKRQHRLRATGLEIYDADGGSVLVAFETASACEAVLENVLRQPLPHSIFARFGFASSGRGRRRASVATAASPLAADRKDSAGSTTAAAAATSAGAAVAAVAVTGALNVVGMTGGRINYRKFVAALQEKVRRDWAKGLVSNLEYLMHLNNLAGRSFNDLAQYPVFPWVLSDYTSTSLSLDDPGVFRDLSKPMGAIGAKRAEQISGRFEALSEQYDEEDPGSSMGGAPFHYGTHYSCAGYVLHYLIRLEPYAHWAAALQTGHFDHPDRLFRSVQSSWRSAAHENLQDVRELTPEFYYSPEIFANGNGFDFGTTQRGVAVDHVELPPWARGDAREFVRVNRAALESAHVSAHLHEWVDLIFGFKQRGAEAVKAMNVFVHLTYDGAVDLDAIRDPVMRTATLDQIENFGKTPARLFKKPHPPRGAPAITAGDGDGDAGDGVRADAVAWHESLAPPFFVVGTPALIAVECVSVIDAPSPPGAASGVGDLWLRGDRVVAAPLGCVVIPPKCYKYLRAGRLDCGVSYHVLTPTPRHARKHALVDVHPRLHLGRVASVAVAPVGVGDGLWIVTGGDDGVARVWQAAKPSRAPTGPARSAGNSLSDDTDVFRSTATADRVLRPVAALVGHTARVTCTDVCVGAGVIATASLDRTVCLWDLSTQHFIRRLASLAAPATHVAISQADGDVLVLAGAELRLYSVNGQLIAKTTTSRAAVRATGGTALRPATAMACAHCPTHQHRIGVVAVTGHPGGEIALWGLRYDHERGRERLSLRAVLDGGAAGHTAAITAVRVVAGGREVLVGDAAGHVSRWSTRSLARMPPEEVATHLAREV